MKGKSLIIIPAYNEEKYIEEIIKEVRKNTNEDILIINDGSTDRTGEIVEKLKKEIKNLKIIHHKKNEGYGQSLIDGFKYAIKKNYDYVITIDCDKQHEPANINNFMHEIAKNGIDVISGSRYLKISPEELKSVPADRFIINKKITEKINKITGYNITDAFCGMKAYKVRALKKLKLSEKGYGLPVQFWIQAKKKGLKIKELPVKLIYIDYNRNFCNIFGSPMERYKYYLKIFEKELNHEDNDNSSTS